MFDALYEMIYIMLFATVIINFAIAHIMHWLNVGEARFLSPIIGTGIGWLVIWAAPGSIAGTIVGAVVTIIANLVLTYVVYPKIEESKLADKIDESIDKSNKSRDEKDFDKILFSPTADERVKYLCRHMRWNKYYCFNFSADDVQVFNAIKESIDNSDLSTTYPDLKITIYAPTEEKPDGVIHFGFQGVQLAIAHGSGQSNA